MKDLYDINIDLKIKCIKNIYLVTAQRSDYYLKKITGRTKMLLYNKENGKYNETASLNKIYETVDYCISNNPDLIVIYCDGLQDEMYVYNSKYKRWDKAANLLSELVIEG